eukprot:CAMPEP_0118917498 /NCGR_PEP_ID=MMETSP1166-20130328/17360_1 /TAXON_ID=1104430 /ORGANISM="Chrysoreinhardia sp, Strain CCMP3193" /LENGTH=214 /DNA_ID=CAMNT_0006857679 /DNA_START=152 /DNA_END=796 /DNA_ORIENTATION=-
MASTVVPLSESLASLSKKAEELARLRASVVVTPRGSMDSRVGGGGGGGDDDESSVDRVSEATTIQSPRSPDSNSQNDDAATDEDDYDDDDLALETTNQTARSVATGRWSAEEHERFLEGLSKFGRRKWINIAHVVKTRSVVQVRSHAQKYFKKMHKQDSPDTTGFALLAAAAEILEKNDDDEPNAKRPRIDAHHKLHEQHQRQQHQRPLASSSR